MLAWEVCEEDEGRRTLKFSAQALRGSCYQMRLGRRSLFGEVRINDPSITYSTCLLVIFFSIYYIVMCLHVCLCAQMISTEPRLCILNLSTLLDKRVKRWLFNLWPTHGDGTSFWKWNLCMNRGLLHSETRTQILILLISTKCLAQHLARNSHWVGVG